tara:strand:+ start:279 stop:1181 length:903 start_codon:yes stop_codon:yes gene_type:complete
MHFSLKILPAILATVTISLQAQMGPPIPAGKTLFSSQALVIVQNEGDLDGGGDVSVDRFGFKFGVIHGLERGRSIGATIDYKTIDYDFSNLLGASPWEEIEQWSLALQYRHAIDRESAIFAMPSVSFSSESSASLGDGLEFGGIFGYTKQLRPDLALGFGGGFFTGLEDTSGFPVIFVYWQIDDAWRLSNPFRPGPSGPAGLEFVYTGITDWEFGFSGGYRTNRFALDATGIAPDGFGENSGAALLVRASREFTSGGQLDFHIGTVAGGELELEDRSGRGISSTDTDPAILFSVAFTQRW